MELGPMDRQLADRPVEIHIRNPPCTLILMQQIVEPRRLAVRLDDPEKQDYLAADNVRYTYLELRKDIPVLLIDPEHGGGMEQSSFPDSFYIANALSGTSQVCSCSPPIPSGCCALWLRPAT